RLPPTAVERAHGSTVHRSGLTHPRECVSSAPPHGSEVFLMRTLLLAALAACAAGCGTANNLQGVQPVGTLVYGGAARSCRYAGESADLLAKPDGPSQVVAGCVGAAYFTLVDLPLSVVADTLTLPWAAYVQVQQAPYSREIQVMRLLEELH